MFALVNRLLDVTQKIYFNHQFVTIIFGTRRLFKENCSFQLITFTK